MTDETLAEILAILQAAGYRLDLTAEQQRMWLLMLQPLPDDAAKAAALDIARTHPYPEVKPAHLWLRVMGPSPDPEADLQAEAEAAIRHLETHLSTYEPVNLGAELNFIVREMGGPDQIAAQVASGEWRFRRPEAQRLYLALKRRGIPPTMLATPEWPEVPRRINGPADVPEVQHRVFEAVSRPALPEGESNGKTILEG